MPETMVAEVRRFNRTVATHIGALNERFLGRTRPMAQARLLWEIGPDGAEIRALRARLQLDSGYLSRLLRALEAADLVEVVPGDDDRRTRIARLTPAGRAEREILDERSDDLARSLLEPLSDEQRDELVSAMRKVDRLLTAGVVDIRPVDPVEPDAQRCIAAYVAELNRRADRPFDPAAGTSAEPHELRPPAGALLVAYLGAQPVGCGALKHHDDGPHEIKRVWVDDAVRGLGIARRLMHDLEARAKAAGADAVRLDTNAALTEAIAMYRRSGYVEIPRFNDEPFADHWFEKRL